MVQVLWVSQLLLGVRWLTRPQIKLTKDGNVLLREMVRNFSTILEILVD